MSRSHTRIIMDSAGQTDAIEYTPFFVVDVAGLTRGELILQPHCGVCGKALTEGFDCSHVIMPAAEITWKFDTDGDEQTNEVPS